MNRFVVPAGLVAVAAAVALGISQLVQLPQQAETPSVREYQLRLARQSLAAALRQLQEQSDILILTTESELEETLVGPLHGNFRATEALRHLLENSGFAALELSSRAFRIIRLPKEVAARGSTFAQDARRLRPATEQ